MRLEEAFGPGALEQTSAACLGVAPRLKRALEAAVADATTTPLRDLDILVGLLGVPDCAAARVLAALGITIEDVQARLPA